MTNKSNLQEISQEQACNLSKFFMQSGKNLFLMGRRGIGKTEILIEAAKTCGFKCNYINLSVLERCDLSGYPNMTSSEDVVTFKSPHFLPKLKENTEPDTVLFFDEVDKCSPELTAPLLEILQFRKINNVNLNVRSCILTGNLSDEGAHSNTISTALLDRTAKYILKYDFHQWVDWAKANQVHDLVLGFLRSNPEFACGKIDDSCYASPSPRGWTMASEALIKAKELKIVDIDTVTHIISGFVGNEAGLRFRLWYEHYRKFEPIVHTLIYSGNLTIDYHELTPTEKVIFVITACYHAKQKLMEPSKKNRFLPLENLCKFLTTNKVDYEVQVMGLYNSFDFDYVVKNKLYECKPFFELFTKISESVTIKGK
jgi:AAA domain (dynein-related subfamily)